MSKPHRPRPILISFPDLPVTTILAAAKLFDAAHETHTSHALLAWAEEIFDSWFQELIVGLPRQENQVFNFVHDTAWETMTAVPTTNIVDALVSRGLGRPTGIRGALSRLVEKGILCRVAEGYYWPANIAYDKKAETPE